MSAMPPPLFGKAKIVQYAVVNLRDNSLGWLTPNTTVTLIEQSHSLLHVKNEAEIDKKYWNKKWWYYSIAVRKSPTSAFNNLDNKPM